MTSIAIVATISDGNVRCISRHQITTDEDLANLVAPDSQIWISAQTARSLLNLPDTGMPNYCAFAEIGGVDVHIKSDSVMETA